MCLWCNEYKKNKERVRINRKGDENNELHRIGFERISGQSKKEYICWRWGSFCIFKAELKGFTL
jgi:hypothetical protein